METAAGRNERSQVEGEKQENSQLTAGDMMMSSGTRCCSVLIQNIDTLLDLLLTYCYFTSIKLFYCLLLYCFNTLDAVKRRNEDHSCCTDHARLRWILDRDWLQRSYDVIKSRRFVKLRPKEKSQKLSSFSWWTLNSFCTLKNKLNKVVIIINLLILWSFNLVPLHRYITTEGS